MTYKSYGVEEKVEIFKKLMLVAYDYTNQFVTLESKFSSQVFSDYQDAYFTSRNKSNDFFEWMPTDSGKKILLLERNAFEIFNENAFIKELEKMGVANEPFIEGIDFNEIHDENLELFQEELMDVDRDTKGFTLILRTCRNDGNSFNGQQNYNEIRNFIFESRYGFSNMASFEMELKKRGIKKPFSDLLKESLEVIEVKDGYGYYHCFQCGRPVSKRQLHNTKCVHYRCKEHNAIYRNKLRDVSNKTLFWNKGFYKSVIIPTFLEESIMSCINRLLPEASVIKYPDIERMGDILVELYDKKLCIDAKDYKNKRALIKYLKSERNQNMPAGTLIVTNDLIQGSLKDNELNSRGIEIYRLKELKTILVNKFKPKQITLGI